VFIGREAFAANAPWSRIMRGDAGNIMAAEMPPLPEGNGGAKGIS
jgi:hypothetical protein